MRLPGKEKMHSLLERYQKGRLTSTMLIFSWTLAPPDQPLRSSQLHSGSDAYKQVLQKQLLSETITLDKL